MRPILNLALLAWAVVALVGQDKGQCVCVCVWRGVFLVSTMVPGLKALCFECLTLTLCLVVRVRLSYTSNKFPKDYGEFVFRPAFGWRCVLVCACVCLCMCMCVCVCQGTMPLSLSLSLSLSHMVYGFMFSSHCV